MAKPSKKIRQKQKDDATEFAVLLYDIFKEVETKGKLSSADGKKFS
jgi:hypothetical protein